jgi:hypothetical protein
MMGKTCSSLPTIAVRPHLIYDAPSRITPLLLAVSATWWRGVVALVIRHIGDRRSNRYDLPTGYCWWNAHHSGSQAATGLLLRGSQEVQQLLFREILELCCHSRADRCFHERGVVVIDDLVNKQNDWVDLWSLQKGTVTKIMKFQQPAFENKHHQFPNKVKNNFCKNIKLVPCLYGFSYNSGASVTLSFCLLQQAKRKRHRRTRLTVVIISSLGFCPLSTNRHQGTPATQSLMNL